MGKKTAMRQYVPIWLLNTTSNVVTTGDYCSHKWQIFFTIQSIWVKNENDYFTEFQEYLTWLSKHRFPTVMLTVAKIVVAKHWNPRKYIIRSRLLRHGQQQN